MKIEIRHPRPMGTTEQITQYHKLEPTQNKEKTLNLIRKRLIQLYVTNDMQLNEERWTINKLAKYLNTNPTIIMKGIQEQISKISGFMQGTDEKALTRVLFFRALNLGLDVQGIGTQQVEVLMRAQGNKYVPFLTGAVNQAIGNLNNILKSQIELSRSMGSAHIATNINEDKQFGNTGTKYLTPDEAVRLLSNGPTLLTDEAYLDLKENELGELPDVCARNQDLSTIGIKLNKTILIPKIAPIPTIDETPLTARDIASKATHGDRDR